MSAREFMGRVQTKRDTRANWTAANPVLLDGEEILVDTASGEVRKKIGDGVNPYIKLPFADEAIRNLIGERVATNQGVEHAGKFLGIGADGLVKPITQPTGGGAKTWGDLAGITS